MKILIKYNKRYFVLTKYTNGTWRMRDIFRQDSAQITAKMADDLIKNGVVIESEKS